MKQLLKKAGLFPVAFSVLLTVTQAGAFSHDQQYLAPYEVDARRKLFGRPGSVASCPSPVPALYRIDPPAFYADRKEWWLQVKPLYTYLVSISRITDGFVRQSPASLELAQCGLAWLYGWAKGNALLGPIRGKQGHYERMWASGSISLNYLKIREQPRLDKDQMRKVESWIDRLSVQVEDAITLRNNLAYWNGLTNMLNGVVLDRSSLFQKGVRAYRLALTEMRSDGVLPRELTRGKHALHYHNFALIPLVFIAEIAARQGINLYSKKSRKDNGGGADIHKLVDLIIRSIEDPGFFEAFYPGKPAKRVGKLSRYVSDADMVWMEPYYARFREPRLPRMLSQIRPIFSSRTGGDATLGWGAKKLPQ